MRNRSIVFRFAVAALDDEPAGDQLHVGGEFLGEEVRAEKTRLPVSGLRSVDGPRHAFLLVALVGAEDLDGHFHGNAVGNFDSGKRSSLRPSKVQMAVAAVRPRMKLRYVHSSPTLMPFSFVPPVSFRKESLP